MRLRWSDGALDIRLPGGGFHVTPDSEITEHTAKQESRLDRLQTLLRATLLEPLYQASEVARQNPTTYHLVTKSGAKWKLVLRLARPPKGRAVFLPFTLTSVDSLSVKFVTHLHTGVTHLPRKVEYSGFGAHWFSLENSGIDYLPAAFTDPTKERDPTNTGIVITTAGAARLQRCGDPPEILDVPARTCLIAGKDPGDWDDRVALLNSQSKKLATQGQERVPDVYDFIYEEDGARYWAMPFQMRPVGGKPFVPRKGQKILRLLAQTVVKYFPKTGSLEKCEKAAAKVLRTYVEKNGLKVAGPLRISPWVSPVDGVPPPNVQNRMRVQFELPIER